MKTNHVIDMKSSQFPFGQINDDQTQLRKILVKKRIYYKSQKQHLILQEKINILKNIYHRNTINFRQVQDNQNGSIDVYYNYVPFLLQNFFQDCNAETIKQVHKQLIQLAIHLAKNCLLTSFNPNRCGVVLNADKKWQIKYYLPLNQIVITNNVTMLDRSVQLFTVQSMHLLDTMNEAYQPVQNQFQRSQKKLQLKYRQSVIHRKKSRRQSQPYVRNAQKQRRFSNQAAFLQFSRRKFSNVSKQKSQISMDSLKNTNASTLFQTLRSSSPGIQKQLKKCDSSVKISLNANSKTETINKTKRLNSRSKRALNTFKQIVKTMQLYKRVQASLNCIRN